MTKEETIKYLRQIYPNGGHCWLDSQRIEAIEMAISALSQPSLPSNLDEAAQKIEDYYDVGEEHGYLYCHRGDIKDAFKAGAEWMAGQGETIDGEVVKDINNNLIITAKGFSGKEAVFGDKVIVQIRKKCLKEKEDENKGD